MWRRGRTVFSVSGPSRRPSGTVLRDGDAAMALMRFDAREVSSTDILNELNAPTLFASERVIVVSNAHGFIGDQKEALARHACEKGHPVRLVLETDQSPNRLRLGKKLEAAAVIVACYELRGSDIGQFLVAEARGFGKRIKPEAARVLSDRIGSDAAALAVEIEKLSIFVGEKKEISAEDVEALVGGYRNYNVFELARSVVRGDADKAYAAVAKLREDGVAFPMIVGGACRRDTTGDDHASGAWPPDNPRAMPPRTPASPGGRRTPRRRPRDASIPGGLKTPFATLAESDVAVKKGIAVEDTVFEELIARTASGLSSSARY